VLRTQAAGSAGPDCEDHGRNRRRKCPQAFRGSPGTPGTPELPELQELQEVL